MFSKDIFQTANKKKQAIFNSIWSVKEFMLTLYNVNQPVLIQLPSHPQLHAETGHQRESKRKVAFAKE